MIRLESIRKEYDDLIAVRNLSLKINKGDIFGLIGPNGAGKTTTMKIIMGLLEATDGQAYINDRLVSKDDNDLRRIVGYMPDFFSLYDEHKVWEYLDFFASAYKIPYQGERINEVLALMDLTEKKNDYVANLSRGMKQRLAFGKTLLHNPDILVLDEPASGLDPAGRIKLRDTIKKLAAQGKTIMISSHILTELSDICNVIGIMSKGSIVETGAISDIITRIQGHKLLHLDILGNAEQAIVFIKTLPLVTSVVAKNGLIEIAFGGTREEIPQLHRKLIENNIQVVSLFEYRQNLEDIFMAIAPQEVS